MTGFSKFNRPKRPGSYARFIAKQQERVVPTTAETLVVPFIHNWGPYKQVVALNSYADFISVFGDLDGPGKVAVQQAFRGEDVPGYGGAGTVLAYRFGGSAALQADVDLSNTTPAVALTLKAKYQGTRGNGLAVTIQTNSADGTKKDVIIKDGALELERFTHLATDVAGLVAKINDDTLGSDWVEGVSVVTGVALANVANVSFTGGNDGATTVTGDWTDMLAAIEPERFAVFAPGDLTDSDVLTAVRQWANDLNEPPDVTTGKSKRFLTVVGGDADDDISAALARTEDDLGYSPYFVNLGVGTYVDEALGELTTAQLAPRVGGILVNRGETESVTLARLRGLSFGTGAPTNADCLAALEGGVTVIGRDSHTLSPLRLEKGVTAYIDNTAEKPYRIWSVPKFLMTMGGFETEVNELFAFNVVGKLPASAQSTREYVLGEARRIVAERVVSGSISALPAPVVEIDNDPPPEPTDEYVGLYYEWTFGRSTEQVFHSIVVS